MSDDKKTETQYNSAQGKGKDKASNQGAKPTTNTAPPPSRPTKK